MEARTVIAVRQARRKKPTASYPVALMLRCLVVVGLVALLYLWQVSAATNSAAQLQASQAEQSALQRQDAALHQQLGVALSPAYIDQRARAMGLAPAGAGVVTTLRLGDDSQP